MHRSSPAAELGLPAPTDSVFADAALRDVYAQFINQLDFTGDCSAILSNPYQLSLESTPATLAGATAWLDALDPSAKAKLLLVAVLSRPFDASVLWPGDKPRFIDDELVALEWVNLKAPSLAEGRQSIALNLDALLARLGRNADAAVKKLIEQIPQRASVSTLSSGFVGDQPGNYAYQMWQVARWSVEWNVVFAVVDVERNHGYPFPWLLGFCRADNAERNFVALLREGSERYDMGFYSTNGSVFGEWQFAKLALTDDPDGERPAWNVVDALLPMEAPAIQSLLQAHVQGSLGDLILRLKKIMLSADEAELGSQNLAELLNTAHAGTSLDALEAFLAVRIDEGQEQYAKEQERLEKLREERLLPFRPTIDVWAKAFAGPGPRHDESVFDWQFREKHIRRYMENHVIEHGELPHGQKDFGRVRSGYKSSAFVGIVDFDALARLAPRHGAT